jgi:hypothetical protein
VRIGRSSKDDRLEVWCHDPPMKTSLRAAFWLLVFGSFIGLLRPAQASARTTLGIQDTRFTLNEKPTFLQGISYYGALGAPAEFIRLDLDDLQRHGCNWIRVWATWAAFSNNVAAVEEDGSRREPFLTKLKNLVADCDRRGLVVDVTLSRGNGVTGPPKLQTHAAHRRAVETIVTALQPWRNWYLDLSNERNIKDQRYTSVDELRDLRELVRRLDPSRLVTASHAVDITREELREYLFTVQVDFITPHRPRNAGTAAQTKAKTLEYLAWMKELQHTVPVHYQEPFRRGYGSSAPAADFLTDWAGAQAGGAAGWCFHNGDNRASADGRPRRSFDLRAQRLFDQLDAVETNALALLDKARSGGGTTATRPFTAPRGPLRAHPTNSRYFTDDGQRAVYLTGAHTWDNLQDMGEADPPKAFDFDAYLDFLARHDHNFIRLWRWELLSWDTAANDKKTAIRLSTTPHPWTRTGPGLALDGQPKFDLERFNEAYFERLRSRVAAARDRDIYVSVMLFEGWGLQHVANAWKAHPFHPDNHINGLAADLDGDGRGLEVHTLRVPVATRYQEAYVRKVMDTLNDLDNVLYEIANESGAYSIDWQEHFIRFVHDYEKGKPKQHPVGMTFPYSRDPKQRGNNSNLFRSSADWISPNPDADQFNYRANPPSTDGGKVILTDTDHLWGIGGDVAWVWKSFLCGLNPIFMDPYRQVVLQGGADSKWEPVRRAMGVTRRLAERLNLASLTPHAELASSGYCLAHLANEYLVYIPSGGQVELDLADTGRDFQVEWIHPVEGTVSSAPTIGGGAKRVLKAPFNGPAVVHLQSAQK